MIRQTKKEIYINTKLRNLYSAFAILAALMLALAAPATTLAMPPTTEDVHWSGIDFFDCGNGSYLIDEFEGDVTLTYFWNQDGTLDRYKIHGVFHDTITNPLNGMVVYGRNDGYNFFENVEHTPGVWKHAGLMFHVVVPGQGLLNIDAGLFYYTVDSQTFEFHGKHEYNNRDFEELCAYMN